MDVVRQRLVGKPRNTIIDELVTAMRNPHRSGIVSVILRDFDIIRYINSINVLAVMDVATIHNHCDVFMYLLDNYTGAMPLIDGVFNHRKYLCLMADWLINKKSIPMRYIGKFYKLFEYDPALQSLFTAPGTSLKRVRYIINLIAENTGKSQITVARTFQQTYSAEMCTIDIILEMLHDNPDVVKLHFSVQLRSLSRSLFLYPFNRRVAKFAKITCEWFCRDVLAMLNKMALCQGTNYKSFGTAEYNFIQTYAYVLARCDAEIINQYPPRIILNVAHYNMLLRAGLQHAHIIKAIYRHDYKLAKSIMYDMYIRGYSWFDEANLHMFNIIDHQYIDRRDLPILCDDALAYDCKAVEFKAKN